MSKSTLLACCLALSVVGCDGRSVGRPTPDESDRMTMEQVGDLLRHYQLTKKKAPQKLADFVSVQRTGGGGFEAIRNGRVVVFYGAELTDITDEPAPGTSDQVVAYPKQVPESGGYVLMLDRSVKKMTADEFKAAPKPAGTKASDLAPVKSK